MQSNFALFNLEEHKIIIQDLLYWNSIKNIANIFEIFASAILYDCSILHLKYFQRK